MISLYSKCRYLLIAQRLCVLLLILPALVSCQQPFCDESLGVCPPPDTGTFVNTIGLTKSVYFKDECFGERTAYDMCPFNLQTLCYGDVDQTPGDELILYAPSGLQIVTSHPTSPAVIAQISVPEEVNDFDFIDVDLDGDSEYFLHAYYESRGYDLRMYLHAGDLGWHARGQYHWATWDLNADGIVEFILGSERGVRIVSPIGEVLGAFGNGPFCELALADTDGIEPPEIVTSSSNNDLIIWRSDGLLVGEFDMGESCYFDILQDPAPEGHHLVWLGGERFIVNGNQLVQRSDVDTEYATRTEVELRVSRVPTTCIECWPETDAATSTKVRFLADAEPFCVEFDYSIMTTYPFVAGYGSFEPTRTIVSVFDSAGVLVYHEVFRASSGPGSFAVIPSDVEGEEILLVADGTDIVAYRAPHQEAQPSD